MINIDNNTAQDILSKLSPTQQKIYGDILTGRAVKTIKCMSKTCKGRIIGHFLANGRIVDVDGLNSYRERLDGNYGFACRHCRQNSIQSEQERGIMPSDGSAPSKEQLNSIFEAVSNKPTKDKAGIIDGFLIEEIKQ